MATILVTGGGGQLAQALGRAKATIEDLGTLAVVGRPDFDLGRPDSMTDVARAHGPAIVINAAAWTAVDAAEAEPEAAAMANTTGPATLARICDQLGARLVHISTDYVYDGLKGAPYVETDLPRPTGVYGRTKLDGERAVRDALPAAVVLRTSWVYAESGRNFVLTMLNAARRLPELRVVADQQGCPTNADDLAHAVLAVVRCMLADGGTNYGGVYHAAGSGAVTWHGFAEAIFDYAAQHGRARPIVHAIATADWPTPARRPPDSRLDCTQLAKVFGVRLPDWRPSLQRAVSAICTAQP